MASFIDELPQGYTPCEYLESSGNQYINIQVGFYKTDIVKTRFSIIKYTIQDKYMVSPSVWNDSNNRFSMGTHYVNSANGQKYTCAYGSSTTSNTHLKPNTLNDCNIHTYCYSNEKFQIIDLSLSLDVSSISFGNETTNLILFYGYNRPTSGKMCYYTHEKANGEKYNLVAALDANGIPCMYDTENKVTYYNNGTGTFGYKTKDGNIVNPT